MKAFVQVGVALVGTVALSATAFGGTGGGSVEVCTEKGCIRFSSFAPGTLRVTRGTPVSREFVFDRAPVAEVTAKDEGDVTRVSAGGLSALVDRRTGLVRFVDAKGAAVLSEKELGAKEIAFDSPTGERLYGLGQFQDGQLELRNVPRRLTQVNTQISIPFVVSTRGWGLYWHTYSRVDFNPCDTEIALKPRAGDPKAAQAEKDPRVGVELFGTLDVPEEREYAFFLDGGTLMSRLQIVDIDGFMCVFNRNSDLPPNAGFRRRLAKGRHAVRVIREARDAYNVDRTRLWCRPDRNETRFRSDCAQGTDYVVYLGEPKQAVAAFRASSGGTAALPEWVWGYWHCQERFHDQQELLKAAHWFHDRGLPVSVIVQDWFWWLPKTWSSMEWDRTRYPDPKGMVDECHKLGMRVMLSVWSKAGGDCPFVAAMKRADGFIGKTSWIDFSKPAAVDLYWDWFARNLVSTGVDAWWLDATEPENDALHGETIELGAGDEYRNLYPLLVNREADARLRKLRPGVTPLVLTRSAFAGQARTASAVWSGDVCGDWHALRLQTIAGQGAAMAGIPYWTTDAGGFYRPQDQYENEAYHRLFLRWVEFATFCPIQRIHGYSTDTTPSRFGPVVEKIICDQIRLRERIRPYVKATADAAALKNLPMMTPLFDAPPGFETEYMLGEEFLVCPVTEDVTSLDVWLPGGEWVDFHTGRKQAGGRILRVDAPLDRIPVYRLRAVR